MKTAFRRIQKKCFSKTFQTETYTGNLTTIYPQLWTTSHVLITTVQNVRRFLWLLLGNELERSRNHTFFSTRFHLLNHIHKVAPFHTQLVWIQQIYVLCERAFVILHADIHQHRTYQMNHQHFHFLVFLVRCEKICKKNQHSIVLFLILVSFYFCGAHHPLYRLPLKFFDTTWATDRVSLLLHSCSRFRTKEKYFFRPFNPYLSLRFSMHHFCETVTWDFLQFSTSKNVPVSYGFNQVSVVSLRWETCAIYLYFQHLPKTAKHKIRTLQV